MNKESDIIDMSGYSVKESFVLNNEQYYKEQKFLVIQSYFNENMLRIVYKEKNKKQSRASISYNNSERVFHSFITSDYNYKIEFEVECYANIRVNDATGVITSFSGPSLDLTYFSPRGSATLGNLDSVSTSYEWVTSAHRGMYFYYSYRAKLEVAESYGQKSTYYTPMYSKTIRSHY